MVLFGLVAVYAASAVFALQRYGNGYHFLVRQGFYAFFGLSFMLMLSRMRYHALRAITYPILALSAFLLFLTLVGVGRKVGGATRWIPLGLINIQPAEIAKLSIILWLAYSLSKKSEKMKTFSVGFLPHVLIAGFFALLCLWQPDFGSAMMIVLLTFIMLFAAGAKVGYLLGGVLCSLPVIYLLVAGSEYRQKRIEAFLAPLEHRYGIGYQVTESLMSFGAGGLTGVGLGDSRQKLFYLPEAHTDFIGSIVAEELGFIGVGLLILGFLVLLLRGLYIAFHAEDEYGTYLAFGGSMFVALQAFTNLAVAMGLLPTKGLVLPFLGYGGSSLLVNCCAMGIVISVSRRRMVQPFPARRDSSSRGVARLPRSRLERAL